MWCFGRKADCTSFSFNWTRQLSITNKGQLLCFPLFCLFISQPCSASPPTSVAEAFIGREVMKGRELKTEGSAPDTNVYCLSSAEGALYEALSLPNNRLLLRSLKGRSQRESPTWGGPEAGKWAGHSILSDQILKAFKLPRWPQYPTTEGRDGENKHSQGSNEKKLLWETSAWITNFPLV